MNSAQNLMGKTWVTDVKTAANGRWCEILDQLGVGLPMGGQHGPCPDCGGTDRFRFDDEGGRGTWICNQCGAGNGLDLVMKVAGVDVKGAAALVAPLVGMAKGGHNPAELARLQQQQQASTEKKAADEKRKRQKAARRAEGILSDCEPGQAAYLTRKGLAWPQGLINRTLIRVNDTNFEAGSLIVPIRDEAGQLVSVQLIAADGAKHYPAIGRAGAFHYLEGGEPVAVVEGYATGLSVQLATGGAVYCAMDCGNLKRVAEIARRQHPAAPIIICGDHDVDKNTGERNEITKRKTEEAANSVGAVAIFPPQPGDFDDMRQRDGEAAVTLAILRAAPPVPNQLPEAAAASDTHTQASQGNQGAEVIELHPLRTAETEQQSVEGVDYQGVMIGKMAPSQRADLLRERLGEVAVNMVAATVHRYTGSLWEHLPDAFQRREMAAIYADHGVPFSSKMLSGVVDTMKEMIPLMPEPRDDLIGFANGVYDMAAREFRYHSPGDGLLSHNGIPYGDPLPGETLETCAPHFIKWLSHAAESDEAKMERIKAALFMVLANRYDWQLFLEVTGEGGSGKSVMANLCELLVGGRNVGSSSMKRLESDFGLESVWDKRLILLPDQPKYVGDGATLKAITGGDEVSINQKGKAMFSAKVRAVVLATNNEPMVITERNGGMSRRRVIFTFNNVVAEEDKDPQLGEKIAAELPIIIRHLLYRFADPLAARGLLLEQRNSNDAITAKRGADPLFDLCAMVRFVETPNGLRMGGRTDVMRNPRRYFYHTYLAYMEYHGLERPLAVNAVSRALKQIAKELGGEYRTRRCDGVITNIELTDEAEEFMPKPVPLIP